MSTVTLPPSILLLLSFYHCYLLKVYIGDLGSDATRYELEDAFNPFGTVKNVWIAKRPPGRNLQ